MKAEPLMTLQMVAAEYGLPPSTVRTILRRVPRVRLDDSRRILVKRRDVENALTYDPPRTLPRRQSGGST